MNDHIDVLAVTSQGFVDGVVDDLVDHVVITPWISFITSATLFDHCALKSLALRSAQGWAFSSWELIWMSLSSRHIGATSWIPIGSPSALN